MTEGVIRLGDEETITTAIRILRRQGQAGCRELGRWVLHGGEGGDDDQLLEAARLAMRAGDKDAIHATVRLVDHPQEEIRESAMAALSQQLPTLSAQEAERLVANENPAVRRRAAEVLIGQHWEYVVVGKDWNVTHTPIGVFTSVEDEIELENWGVDDFPAAHEQPLGHLVIDPDSTVRHHVALLLGVALVRRPEPPRSFGQHLRTLVLDDGETVAICAARATGLGSPFNGPEIVRDILKLGDEDLADDLIDELLEGVDDSLDNDITSPFTIDMLETLIREGPEEYRKEANELSADARELLRRQAARSEASR